MHADSQITLTEALRLTKAALMSPKHRTSKRLVRGVAVSTQEFLGQWILATPEGPMHTVAMVGMLDGQTREFESWYRDGADADATYEHLRETGVEAGTIAA